MSLKQTFVVDIGETMTAGIQSSSDSSRYNEKQKFFCKCGHSELLNYKVKRTLVKNIDDLRDGSDNVSEVECSKCGTVYSDRNKISLLNPNSEELFAVRYYHEEDVNSKGEKELTLYKLKHFVEFKTSTGNLHYREDYDFIRFNETTRDVVIFLTPPNSHEDDLSVGQEKDYSIRDIKCTKLTLSNAISLLEPFYKYFEFVSYEGLELAFEYLKSLDEYVADFESIKDEAFISFIYNNHKIIREKNSEGEYELYRELPSGFEDGETELSRLNVGDYLRNLEELSRMFFSIISFPNITTIILTKKCTFLNSLLQSTSICNPCVYKNNQATNPTKILEISTNYNRIGEGHHEKKDDEESGMRRRNNHQKIEDSYLKISKVLYKNIAQPTDMEMLLETYSLGFLTKIEIESLFQRFDANRLYKLFGRLTKTNRDDIRLNFKHIMHILEDKLDDLKNNFLETYIDTIRTIDLLDMEDKTIFKIKDYNQLKEKHDEYAARFNAIKDIKQAEFYAKAAKDFEDLNMIVDEVEFTVIPQIEQLHYEGNTLEHCIPTYMKRVCEKRYLAIGVRHTLSLERATGGFIRSGNKLSIEQLKGYQNSRASADLIHATIKFCKINGIDCPSVSDLQPNKGYEKRMKSYRSDEEVQKIRDEIKKKEEEKAKEEAEKKKKDAEAKKASKKKEQKVNNEVVTEQSDNGKTETVEESTLEKKKSGFLANLFNF